MKMIVAYIRHEAFEPIRQALLDAGLDISEHGMYGYPEQFIPEPELIGYGALPADTKGYAGAATVTAMTTTDGATA